MGRGDEQERGQTGGRGLLFGPRSPKTLGPAQRREISRRKRQRASAARKSQHLQALRRAEDELTAGNAAPLRAFLERPAPHGTIAAERQELEAMADRLGRHFGQLRPLGRPDIDSIIALQQLRRRAETRRLVSHRRRQLRNTFAMELNRLVGEDLHEILRRQRRRIGLLPQVWIQVRPLETHLRDGASGRLLCGGAFVEDTALQHLSGGSGELTPLSTDVSCAACRERFQTGATVMSLGVEEWWGYWRRGLSTYVVANNHQVSSLYGWGGPSPDGEVDQIRNHLLASHLDAMRERLEVCGCRITDTLLCPPA